MKSTGIVRGVDGLGRIVLPKELRTGSCDFCGEVDDNAIQYAGYCICTSCRKKIGNMKK